jgi:ferric-dicitrate binding protein FerR (iron transport regulator)
MAVDQPRAVVLQSLILREAATWVEALEMPGPSQEVFDQWLHWVDTSDAHRHAYWRMLELWRLTGELSTTAERDT